MVEAGIETGERIEIKSGLKAGDIVLMTGAYLSNSEYIFKKGAKPDGVNENVKIFRGIFEASQARLTSTSIPLWGINTSL